MSYWSNGLRIDYAAPTNPYSLPIDQLLTLNSNKLDQVVTEGDVVHLLGMPGNFITIRFVKSNLDSMDPFGKSHSEICIEYDEYGNMITVSPPLYEYLGIEILNILKAIQIKGAMSGSILAFLFKKSIEIVILVCEGTKWALEQIDKVKKQIIGFIKKTVNTTQLLLNKISETVDNYVASVNHSVMTILTTIYHLDSMPHIVVNTDTLIDYANRLTKLQYRILSVEKRIKRLSVDYFLKGLLYNPYKKDPVTESINYLNSTAKLFENAESKLLRSSK